MNQIYSDKADGLRWKINLNIFTKLKIQIQKPIFKKSCRNKMVMIEKK